MNLFGSGAILRSALEAQQILAEKYGVVQRRVERDQLHPAAPRRSELRPLEHAASRTAAAASLFESRSWPASEGPFVAASDYVRAVGEQLRPWIPGDYLRPGLATAWAAAKRRTLRRHFEVDAESIALAALYRLSQQGKVPVERRPSPRRSATWGSTPEKVNPFCA